MDRREIPRSKRGRTDCAVNCTARSSEEAPWGGTGIREKHQHYATQNSALLFKYITSAISASVSVICVEQLHIYCAKGVLLEPVLESCGFLCIQSSTLKTNGNQSYIYAGYILQQHEFHVS